MQARPNYVGVGLTWRHRWRLAPYLVASSMLIAHPASADDLIFAPGTSIPNAFNRFAVVMGAPSERGALAQFNCLRKKHPDEAFAVYKVPNPAVNDPRHPFIVTVASYVNESEAEEALTFARSKIDFQKVLECLGQKQAAKATNDEIARTSAHLLPLRTPKTTWTAALKRTPIAQYDGIGTGLDMAATGSVRAVVLGRAVASKSVIYSMASHFRASNPQASFGILQHGEYHYVAVAAFVTDHSRGEAIKHMRRLGLYEFTVTATFPPTITQSSIQTTVDAVDMQGNPFAIEAPGFAPKSVAARLAIVEGVDLIEPAVDRVKRCYGTRIENSADPANPLNTRFDELASCAGIMLSNESLTRCLLGSDCRGPRVPVGYLISSQDLVNRCVATFGNDNLCLGTTLDPTFLAELETNGFRACLEDAEGSKCLDVQAKLKRACDVGVAGEKCKEIEELYAQIGKRAEAVTRCMRLGHCDGLVPRPADVRKRVEREAAKLKITVDSQIQITAEAIALLRDSAAATAQKLKACLDLRNQSRTEEAQTCFLMLGLGAKEKEVLDCLNGATDGQGKVACMTTDPAVKVALERAQCARAAGDNSTELAKCLEGGPAIEQLENATKCIRESGDSLLAATKCASAIPADVLTTLECARKQIDSKQPDTQQLLQCLPNVGERERLAICLANAASDEERIKCVANGTGVDPNVSAALGCMAKSGGSSADLLRCATSPYLPPEVARAASCAATSTGATDFALCAAGSSMNAEARIATECAASTGGAPPAFLSCTAGRLTARELEKCMHGEIGKDGGCFGPNNDIVKAVNTVVNDLSQGLGENNDLRRELGRITEPLKQAGNQLGGAVSGLLQAAGGAIRKIGCDWLRIGC